MINQTHLDILNQWYPGLFYCKPSAYHGGIDHYYFTDSDISTGKLLVLIYISTSSVIQMSSTGSVNSVILNISGIQGGTITIDSDLKLSDAKCAYLFNMGIDICYYKNNKMSTNPIYLDKQAILRRYTIKNIIK